MKGKVLLVSDDSESAGFWAYALGQKGLEVVRAGSAEEALDRWRAETFDLIIIDVYTPQLDGVDLGRRLRAEAVNPILLLTPDGAEANLLEAYQAGVDECVVKPISPRLLLAKVRDWLRRSWTIPAEALNTLQAGDLRLESTGRQVVTADGYGIKLTNLEFRLLHLLMSHAGQVLELNAILDRVWGHTGGGDSVLLENLVHRLRRKIERNPSMPRYIQAVTGDGYTFQP
jgi:DNA-binding response OmpR family regulator